MDWLTWKSNSTVASAGSGSASSSENESTKKFEGPAIGIDLGTTNSCVGVWSHGRVEIIPNDHGHPITPSCVAFTQQGDVLVGKTAKNQAARNPENTLFHVKRWMGRRYGDVIKTVKKMAKGLWSYAFTRGDGGGGGGGECVIEVESGRRKKKYTAEEISAIILKKLKEIAEAYLDSTVKRAVIGVPANFTQAQKQATKEAARLAGLEVVRLVTEPSAAALAYALRTSGGGGGSDGRGAGGGGGGSGIGNPAAGSSKIMVVDWGGGTLDVSIMKVKKQEYAVIAVAGDTHLGGEDIDDALVTHFADEFQRLHRIPIRDSPRAMHRLRAKCEDLKHDLSFREATTICVDCLAEGFDFEMTMSRAGFEELIGPILQKCMDFVEKAIADAGIKDKSEISKVILAGGSTRIPKLQEMLSDSLGANKLCKSIHPDECVAYGATVQAALLTGELQMNVTDLTVVEAVPVTIGMSIAGGSFLRLIPRNSPYPFRLEERLRAAYDGDTSAGVYLYEGEREKPEANEFLGGVTIDGLKPGPPNSGEECAPFSLVLEIDEDGILTVTLRDTFGRSVSKSLGKNWGKCSPEEARRAAEIASKFAREDEDHVGKARARTRLMECIYRIRWRLSLVSDRKEKKRRTKMLDEIEEEVGDSSSLCDIAVYDAWKRHVEVTCGHI
ncbi:hypothetical protein CBR_g28678 [Chara braunii]|uniref:Uncharacterized protein n=1 Tax=Chara braunii TaxID=69332 RepID=A0A388L9K4_CHABU|nr:hypothetical protein CBR_g28678 [Chara braunii]|eukprot:GBG78964.1 hypothetical protein CBR_g28678 [Chara braunii]